MVLNSVPRQALLVTLMAVMFKLVAAQLRAATIQWRPADPVHFDGRVSGNECARTWPISRVE